MGIIGKDFKYTKVDNFIDDNLIKLLETYTNIKHRVNFKNFQELLLQKQSNFETSFYGDPLMESILLDKKSHVEKITGKELIPTYSFWRMYTRYGDLPLHTDRESCEISVTFNISSDREDWPIFMSGNPIYTKPGEAAVYLGREVPHERKEFEGNYCTQCFLHYVDKNGPYSDFAKDKRPTYGIEK